MPSPAIVDSIGIGDKVVIQGGNQITKSYSKKLNPILRLYVRGNSYFPQEGP